MNIPRPGLYWAKVQHGRKPRQIPLPPARPDTPIDIAFHIKERDSIMDRVVSDPDIEAERLPENKIVVAQTLHRLHPELKPTKASLQRKDSLSVPGRILHLDSLRIA